MLSPLLILSAAVFDTRYRGYTLRYTLYVQLVLSDFHVTLTMHKWTRLFRRTVILVCSAYLAQLFFAGKYNVFFLNTHNLSWTCEIREIFLNIMYNVQIVKIAGFGSPKKADPDPI